jgi:outer membrane receptor protein involved in Fe transport
MQELRFTSNDGADANWKWLGGAFYRKVHMTEVSDILASSLELPIPDAVLRAFASLVPGFNGIITEQGQLNTARGSAEPVDVEEAALFGETTVTFWDSLDATVGLRVFRNVSDSRVVFSGVLASNPTAGNGFPVAVREGRLKDEGLNPHVALKYTFNDHVSVYASAAKGFRFGGAQVLVGTLTSQSPDFYKSDTLWSYEIGLRTQWLNDTVIADITPFQLDWKNPQLQQADATGLGSYFDNVGGARSRGVEVALAWATPLRGLTLSVGGSYTDTVTTKHFTTSSGVETEPGTRWPLAAKWQTASSISYQHRLFGEWTGGGSLNYTTISSAPNTLAYLDTVFGYETLDVTLNLANAALFGMPELSLTLANATDERGIISGVYNPQFAKDHNYIRPRTLVARLAFSV